MTTLNVIQVSLELLCCFILIFPYYAVFIGKKYSFKVAGNLQKILIVNMILLLADSLAYLFRGNPSLQGMVLTRVSNYAVFQVEILYQMCLACYVISVVEENGNGVHPGWLKAIWIQASIMTILLVVSQFAGIYYTFDETNHYVRADGLWINYLLSGIMVLTVFAMLLRERRKIRKYYFVSICAFYVVVCFTGILQAFCYGISLLNVGITTASLFMYVVYESERAEQLETQAQQLMEQEKRTAQIQQKLMASAVHPHFLFNCLSAIEGLVLDEPEKALDTLENLSVFLRRSMDALNAEDMIDIRKEIEIVKYYMSLIDVRFNGKVTLDMDEPDPCVNYKVPPFVLQPLVENAVKYGVRKRKGGAGKITIRFREEPDAHVMTVSDDGAGYDPDAAPQDDRSHLGQALVRERLESMCQGTLKIVSVIGEGTTCEMRIPKTGEKA